jgi:two-component system chemotaxis response regulator CheV
MTRTDILLEAGTNELEMLVFTLHGTRFGVNVAKVREAIMPVETVRPPHLRKEVLGVFKLRDQVIPLVSLRRYFDMPEPEPGMEQRVIVTEFCNKQVGFMVDFVDKIFRIGWDKLSPIPPEAAMNGVALTAVAKIDNAMILVIDFEKIMFEIEGVRPVAAAGAAMNADRSSYRVLVAEDSACMMEQCVRILHESGYTNVHQASDGEAAWNLLNDAIESQMPYHVVLSDVEMPRIDGLHLCKKIKAESKFNNVPVILFSSLISRDNLKKGQSVGADAQISKPDYHGLIESVDHTLGVTTAAAPAAPPPAKKAQPVGV